MLQNHIWEPMFKGEFGKYPAEHLIRFIATNFYNKERDEIRILEVGCGPGANVWYISREGFQSYGIDGSPTAIEKAKKRMEEESLKADLQIGDINQLPYEDNFFDAVIDNECIYSNVYDDSDNILKEIKRVLKGGGLFYSRTFAEDMYIGENSIEVRRLEFTEATGGAIANTGFLRLSDKDVINALYGKNFEIISMDKMRYTRNNEEYMVSEWIIISKKK